MKNILFRRLAVLAMGCLLMSGAGCASSAPSRFYQLSSLANEGPTPVQNSPEQSVIVVVGPVRIPDYLDRPQIVTRSGRNELRFAEFDRWAGSLEKDIVRVLVENISTLLPVESFFVTTWVSGGRLPESPSYRVEVSIIRFEGTPGRSVQMKVQWAIFDKDGKLLSKKDSNISEEVHDATYDAFVAALSDALAGLSRDIAGAIQSL